MLSPRIKYHKRVIQIKYEYYSTIIRAAITLKLIKLAARVNIRTAEVFAYEYVRANWDSFEDYNWQKMRNQVAASK